MRIRFRRARLFSPERSSERLQCQAQLALREAEFAQDALGVRSWAKKPVLLPTTTSAVPRWPQYRVPELDRRIEALKRRWMACCGTFTVNIRMLSARGPSDTGSAKIRGIQIAEDGSGRHGGFGGLQPVYQQLKMSAEARANAGPASQVSNCRTAFQSLSAASRMLLNRRLCTQLNPGLRRPIALTMISLLRRESIL